VFTHLSVVKPRVEAKGSSGRDLRPHNIQLALIMLCKSSSPKTQNNTVQYAGLILHQNHWNPPAKVEAE